jgi:HprK-related kinase A
VAEGLLKLYADYELLSDVDQFVDFHVSVVPERRFFRASCAFEMDGIRPFTPLAAGEAFAFLEWGMNWCVTGHYHTVITIHSAVLERNGFAVVMPAPPGSGKSTLCAALMLDGWRLLSDEMALLDPQTGLLQPSPRPVSLKNESIEVIRRRAPSAAFGPTAKDTIKGTVTHLRATRASVDQADLTACPRWIVFPRFQPNAVIQVAERPKASSLIQLAGNSFNHHVHGRIGFTALADMVDDSTCYDLSYGHLDEAIEWFAELAKPNDDTLN